jgi:hypothetical protein
MIPTIESILKALFAGDMDVATASRYIATHIEIAERHGAATPASPQAPAPQAVVSEAMIEAYLTANDAYWRKTDELPQAPHKWRNGTPSEATRVSLQAALAASPQPEAEAQKAVAWLTVCGPTTGCGVPYAGNLAHCPNCGKVNFGLPASTALTAAPTTQAVKVPLADA